MLFNRSLIHHESGKVSFSSARWFELETRSSNGLDFVRVLNYTNYSYHYTQNNSYQNKPIILCIIVRSSVKVNLIYIGSIINIGQLQQYLQETHFIITVATNLTTVKSATGATYVAKSRFTSIKVIGKNKIIYSMSF